MLTYTLARHYTPHGTYGALTAEDARHVAFTCERPRTGEHPCIPEGTYIASRYNSPKHGPNTWQLEAVPGRTNIQIHIANWPSQLLGCIAPGLRFGASPTGEWGVLESGKAYAAFMEETKNESHIRLVITNKDASS